MDLTDIRVWKRINGTQASGHSWSGLAGFEIVLLSQDIVTNKSKLCLRPFFVRRGTSYDRDNAVAYWKINGGSQVQFTIDYDFSMGTEGNIYYSKYNATSNQEVFQCFTQLNTDADALVTDNSWYVFEVTHESDGNKTITVEMYLPLDNTGIVGDWIVAPLSVTIKRILRNAPNITNVAVVDVSPQAQYLFGTKVKGNSQLEFTITATTGDTAITSYAVELNGIFYTSNTNKVLVDLDFAGTMDATVYVYASGGFQDTEVVPITVVDYSAPNMSQFNVRRCDSLGNITNVGESAYVDIAVDFTQVSTYNNLVFNITITNQSLPLEPAQHISYNQTNDLVVHEINTQIYLDKHSTYLISLVSYDLFSTITQSFVIPSIEQFILNIEEFGVGINKPYERGALDILGDVYINDKKLSVEGGVLVFDNVPVAVPTGVITDHEQLTGKSKDNSHPISAITNLQANLDAKEASIGAKKTAFNVDFDNFQGNILPDGVASVGDSGKVAHSNHTHPKDATKQDLLPTNEALVGQFSSVTVDNKGVITQGQNIIEIGMNGETLPTNLAVGGLFIKAISGKYKLYKYDGTVLHEIDVDAMTVDGLDVDDNVEYADANSQILWSSAKIKSVIEAVVSGDISSIGDYVSKVGNDVTLGLTGTNYRIKLIENYGICFLYGTTELALLNSTKLKLNVDLEIGNMVFGKTSTGAVTVR
jgi:hypothetical protein